MLISVRLLREGASLLTYQSNVTPDTHPGPIPTKGHVDAFKIPGPFLILKPSFWAKFIGILPPNGAITVLRPGAYADGGTTRDYVPVDSDVFWRRSKQLVDDARMQAGSLRNDGIQIGQTASLIIRNAPLIGPALEAVIKLLLKLAVDPGMGTDMIETRSHSDCCSVCPGATGLSSKLRT